MSLSDRRVFLLSLASLGALPACRMQPALAPGAPSFALYSQIEVRAPGNSDDFLMTQTLEERLGRGNELSPFQLSYSLEIESSGLGTDRDGATQRVHVTGKADYTLRRRGESGALAQGTVRNFTGFSDTANTVSTNASSQDARARLVRILADDIVERLLLASPDLPL